MSIIFDIEEVKFGDEITEEIEDLPPYEPDMDEEKLCDEKYYRL